MNQSTNPEAIMAELAVITVTAHKRMDAVLKASEERFRQLAETIEDVFWLRETDSRRIIYVSPAYETIWGRPCASLYERPESFVETVHPDDQEQVMVSIQGLNQGRMFNEEYRIVRPDGSIRWVWARTFAIQDESGQVYRLAGLATDITGRKQLEAAIRASEQRYRSLVEQVSDGILIVDRAGFIRFANPAAAALFKRETPELVEQAFGFPVLAGQMSEIDVPRSPEPAVAEMRVIRVEWAGEPAYLVSLRDITARKQAEGERLRLERQLWQTHKAESLGRMAGAIAHHFNNLLGAVMGNLELALDGPAHETTVRLSLNQAMNASRRAAEISRLMLAYVGQGTGQRELHSLATLCQAALPLLNAALPATVQLKTEWDEPGPRVRADAAQLRQVLTNLVINAAEAIGENEGDITITISVTGPAELPAGHFYPPGWQPQAEFYACLSVADSGAGLAPEAAEKIFDPFFSTKFTGRGLGLPVALGIVKAHGGAIAVAGEPDRGATFYVLLPVVAQPLPPPYPAIPGQPGPALEPATVLVVEDEPIVRKVAQNMLQRSGHTVMTAADGVEAAIILTEASHRVDCVLLDLNMPRMNGWETLAALRRIRPSLGVILTSGYDKAQVMAGAPSSAAPPVFLAKPYSLADLQAALVAALRQ